MIILREKVERSLEAISHNLFSDEHPEDLLEKIIEDGVTQSEFENVYRISDSGECNRDAFLCTAIQNSQRDINNRDAYLALMQKEYEIGEWSTSCWNDLDKANDIIACKEKYGKSPALLNGNILHDSGYSILTVERISIKDLPSRKKKKRKNHIDWWIFRDKDVSTCFKVLEV